MYDYMPDPERENEVLHGDKEGFDAIQKKRQFPPLKFGAK